MDLIISPAANGYQATYGDKTWRCAVGRSGLASNKREGDGTSPIGNWPIRQVFYRADRWTRRRPKPSPARPSTGRTAGATPPSTPTTTARSSFPLPPATRRCGATTISTTSSLPWAITTTRSSPVPVARSSSMSQDRNTRPPRAARRCQRRICWNSSRLPVPTRGFAFGDSLRSQRLACRAEARMPASEGWWARQDSNLRQHRYERRVLTN